MVNTSLNPCFSTLGNAVLHVFHVAHLTQVIVKLCKSPILTVIRGRFVLNRDGLKKCRPVVLGGTHAFSKLP